MTDDLDGRRDTRPLTDREAFDRLCDLIGEFAGKVFELRNESDRDPAPVLPITRKGKTE